jgi:hypothetical protein
VRLTEAFQCTLAVETGDAAEAAFEVDFIAELVDVTFSRRKERGGISRHDEPILPDRISHLALK